MTKQQILQDIKQVIIDDYIFVKSEYKLIKIEFKDLIYAEGAKDYLKFYIVNSEKPILTLKSMKSLEEELPKNQFICLHCSFIVNLKKVATIERNCIVFGNTYIPVLENIKWCFFKFIKKGYSIIDKIIKNVY
ncbi:LytTR family DNA-binding domain-containing protein [uncultured Tenacibaculum sp.]|uniref:LytR/AlgR family response regulator transcription factor n=1 Tax=uncultured Tenacibaculum sp. TaxID=174713 RepID=UPI003446E3B1